MRTFSKTLAGLALAAPLALWGTSAHAVPVDLELSLVIDVSGSVSTTEYNLQMDGYANALRSTAVQNNILDTDGGAKEGQIAINTIFFSSSAFTTTLDDFTLLDTAAAINDYAQILETFTRPGSGGTDIQDGMAKARTLLLADNGFESTNLVMDVSGDGTSSATATEAERDAAEAAGITVNGLPIGGTGIENFYQNSVITSDGFIEPAANFDDFGTAVATKLQIETGGTIPLPGILPLFAIGLVGLGYARSRAA